MSYDTTPSVYDRTADELRSASPEDRENLIYHAARTYVTGFLSGTLGQFQRVGYQQGIPEGRARSIVASALLDAARELTNKDKSRGIGR